jgi:hypothetical protein
MQVLGFNFTKIQGERSPEFKEDQSEKKVNSNIDFTNVEKETLEAIKSDILKISFKFDVIYDPKIGHLVFEGVIVLKADENETKQILNDWKEKKVPDSLKLPLLNLVLTKCSLKALQMEDELSLPLHIPLPRITSKKD